MTKAHVSAVFEVDDPSDEEDVEMPDSDRAAPPQPRISVENLKGVEGAIERLNHLGETIHRSSEANQATKIGKFRTRFDSTSFEVVARLAISSFYPDASPSLLEQLSRSMTDMYERFHYRRSRQVRLQARPQIPLSTIDEEPASNTKADPWKIAAPPIARLPAVQQSRPASLTPLDDKSHKSKDSKPTSLDSQEFRKLFPPRKDTSVKSKTRSILVSQVTYPQPSEEALVCDWCFLPLSEDECKGEKWKYECPTLFI